MNMIELKNMSKSFGDLLVLKDISLTVKQGEVLSIIGPSGSGKSTLLRCLIGLETIDSGKIFIEEKEADTVNNISSKLGMVFQNFNLFPHKTVLGNVIEA